MGCCCDWGRVCWDFDPQGARKCGPGAVTAVTSKTLELWTTKVLDFSIKTGRWNLDDRPRWNWCEQTLDFLFGTPVWTFWSGCPSKDTRLNHSFSGEEIRHLVKGPDSQFCCCFFMTGKLHQTITWLDSHWHIPVYPYLFWIWATFRGHFLDS